MAMKLALNLPLFLLMMMMLMSYGSRLTLAIVIFSGSFRGCHHLRILLLLLNLLATRKLPSTSLSQWNPLLQHLPKLLMIYLEINLLLMISKEGSGMTPTIFLMEEVNDTRPIFPSRQNI